MTQTRPLSLVDAHAASYATSVQGDELNTEFMGKLGVKSRNYVARLALARSCSIAEPPPALPDSAGTGKVIKGANLFGDDYRMWIGLLVEHRGEQTPSLPELQDVVRRHWARGMTLLEADWKEVNGDFEEFLRLLAAKAGIKAEGKGVPRGRGRDVFVPRAGAVSVRIGEIGLDLQSQQHVEWLVNGPGTSPHFALLGTLGSGKTRTGTTMIRSMHRQSGCPIILLDMAKGDLAADKALVSELGAEVVDPPRKPVPLDVLQVASQDPSDILTGAMRFRESFARVPSSRLGGAQVDALRDAAQRALTRHHPTRIVDVRDRLREVYAEKRRKDDVAIATFNDLTGWSLFEPKFSAAEFFSRSWIIDLHSATETAQRLVVFLLLDALYGYLSQLPDAPLDQKGHRALRIVLGIDEARKVLGYEQASLIGLVRESRSKGGVIGLMSQSPDDFAGEDENFLENIGLGACFRTNARSSMLTAMLGQPVDLAGLANGVCVTRLAGQLLRIQAWEEPRSA